MPHWRGREVCEFRPKAGLCERFMNAAKTVVMYSDDDVSSTIVRRLTDVPREDIKDGFLRNRKSSKRPAGTALAI